jgi:hypothetical protein
MDIVVKAQVWQNGPPAASQMTRGGWIRRPPATFHRIGDRYVEDTVIHGHVGLYRSLIASTAHPPFVPLVTRSPHPGTSIACAVLSSCGVGRYPLYLMIRSFGSGSSG